MPATEQSEHRNWRIEFDFDRPGAHHMERDEELARSFSGNVLRLYTWSPPAVSIGYQQKMESVDLQGASRLGVDVVRRPTGGRAVLHWNELTYAAILRSEPSEGIYAVHNAIIAALLASLESVGPEHTELTLTTGSADAGFRDVYKPGTLTNAACFASSARHEVTWRGKKVIGSAQRRFGDVVLQHGSILLSEEHLNLPEVLALSPEARVRMKELLIRETATLSDVFDRPLKPQEVADAIASGFADNMSLREMSASQRFIL
jgi:lipoate-protein ligase A